jgi:hypothetical protein
MNHVIAARELWRDDLSISLEFDARDFWVGVFWKDDVYRTMGMSGKTVESRWRNVFVCLLPCLPIHLCWRLAPDA